MTALTQTVYIVDDELPVRSAIQLLMKSVGLKTQGFASADEFLTICDPSLSGCIILDVRMPGTSGLDLQDKLRELSVNLPIIFITAHGDIPMAVQAMKQGAFEFLQKPFREQELIDLVNNALEQDRLSRENAGERIMLAERYQTLTKREQQIMDLVVQGITNKAIAADLNLSQRTIETHRTRIMEKMQVKSLASLVKATLVLQGDEN